MNEKIYIAIWKDRHTDTTAHAFSSSKFAIEWAREKAKEYCKFPEYYEEHDYDGWLFHANYSCESDCIYVVEVEINEELKRAGE